MYHIFIYLSLFPHFINVFYLLFVSQTENQIKSWPFKIKFKRKYDLHREIYDNYHVYFHEWDYFFDKNL